MAEEKVFDLKGIVESKEEKQTKSGNTFFKFKINEKIYNWFEAEEAAKIKVGEYVEGYYTETSDGQHSYKNINSLAPKAKPTSIKVDFTEKEHPEEKVDWDAKERRIVRENALSQANDLLRTALADPKTREIILSEWDVQTNGEEPKLLEVLFNIAKACEEWVYRK